MKLYTSFKISRTMWFTAWIAIRSNVKHLHELVQEMLVQGVIQLSKSAWANPMVLVEKGFVLITIDSMLWPRWKHFHCPELMTCWICCQNQSFSPLWIWHLECLGKSNGVNWCEKKDGSVGFCVDYPYTTLRPSSAAEDGEDPNKELVGAQRKDPNL